MRWPAGFAMALWATHSTASTWGVCLAQLTMSAGGGSKKPELGYDYD